MEQFAERVSAQPKLLAHHYTEAHLMTQALPYWLQADQQATQRFASMVVPVLRQRGLVWTDYTNGTLRDNLLAF